MKKLILIFSLISNLVFAQSTNPPIYDRTTRSTIQYTGLAPKAKGISLVDSIGTKQPIFIINTGRVRIPKVATSTDTSLYTKVLAVSGDSIAFIPKSYFGGGGSGSGTVTSVSVTTANGVSGTVATATTTPAITLALGAITPTSVNSVVVSGSSTPSLLVVGSSTISGSNTGDQTSVTGNAGTATSLQNSRTIGIATGDVTSSGSLFDGTANNTNALTVTKINGTSLAGLSTGILKNTTGTGVPSIATPSDIASTIGSQTAGKSYISPSLASGTPSFGKIKRQHLDSLDTQMGVLISSNWANLTGWTTFGTATITVASNELVLNNSAAGALDLVSGVRNTSYMTAANAEDIFDTLQIRVGTINSTSFGVGVGFMSQHATTGAKNSFMLRICLETANLGKIIYYGSAGGVITTTNAKSSRNGMTISAGDILSVKFRWARTKFVTSIYNRTTRQTNTYTYQIPDSYTFGTDLVAPNAYQHSIFACGGTHYVKAGYTVIGTYPKYADMAFVGDSRSRREYTTTSDFAYQDRVAKAMNWKIVTFAGHGNTTAEATTTEVINAIPKRITLNIGGNNASASFLNQTPSQLFTTYKTMVNTYVSAGYILDSTLFICNLPPRSTYSSLPYNVKLDSAYNTIDLMTMFRAGGATTFDTRYSADGVHENNDGHRLLAEAILNKITIKSNYNPNPDANNSSIYLNPVTNNAMIGGTFGKSDYKLSVVSDSTTYTSTNFHVSNNYDQGGFYLTGNTSGALLGFNSIFNGTNHVAKGTSASIVSLAAGAINFYTNTGLTYNNTYSITQRGSWDAELHVYNSTSGALGLNLPRTSIAARDGIWIGAGTSGSVGVVSSGSEYNGTNWIARATSAATYTQGFGSTIWYGNTSLSIGSSYTPSELMRLDVSGSLLIGGSTVPTSLTKGLTLTTGVAPSASLTDGFIAYSADVSAGNATAFIRSEAGEIASIGSEFGMQSSHALNFTTNSIVRLSIAAGGTTLTYSDGLDMVFNSTNGTKIGTATSQKLAFFNSTPIVQPTGNIITALTNLGLVGSPTMNTTIIGTATNDNATAGNIGENVESSVVSGSAVSLTTATTTNITSVSLTAGDWQCSGNVNYTGTTATITNKIAGISTTSATLPTTGKEVYSGVQTTLLTVTDGITIAAQRFSLSGTTTVYLVAQPTFSAGTMTGFGSIGCRRVR